MRAAVLTLGALSAVFVNAGTEPELIIGRSVRDDRCLVVTSKPVFGPRDSAVFVQASVHTSGRVVIEWIDPAGNSAGETTWGTVPPAACLITQLPLAGRPAGRTFGLWKVRAKLSGKWMERTFQVEGQNSATEIATASVRPTPKGMMLEIRGTGLSAGAIVHVAQFTLTGGWKYLAAMEPLEHTETTLTAQLPSLIPGEYIAVLRTVDGAVSTPARFIIASERAYQLPVPSGESWVITQGPHGAFSHWNRSEHAWDIAPHNGRYVVAMRNGIVHTHDLGMGQTPNIRSFGNYITIDHGDGEYSHYAHLATGRFLVTDGERVDAGQRIAIVGNSGYTLGPGGGYHVHVHVTRTLEIFAQSIPFAFNEDRPSTEPPSRSAQATAIVPRQDTETVQVGQWWTRLVTIPPPTTEWTVEIAWTETSTDLDLHLMSPSGRHYGWYGDQSGYTGRTAAPERFHLIRPEPGTWRISVQGMRGSREIRFRMSSSITQRSQPAISARSKKVQRELK